MAYWCKNTWRIISHPYAFFEEAINRAKIFPATATFIIAWFIINTGWYLANSDSFPVTGSVINFVLSLLTYPVGVFASYLVSRIWARESKLRSFFAVWGFSYLPTFILFFIILVIHLLMKFSLLSKITIHPLLILVLWAFMFLLLLWKILFLGITLRLAGNLNFSQIMTAFLILGLILALYWGLTFNFGWLKIPFV